MNRCDCVRMFVGLAIGVFSRAAYGDELTIYQIQSNTSNGDSSIYHTQTHNVTGGIVTHIWHRAGDSNERVYLQDPAHATWGAIVVKDSHLGELSNNVNVGDWVSFDNIYIEEFRGTTFLQYNKTLAPSVTFTVESTGNPVPAPTVLTAADLVVPVNHAASEPYESMVVTLQNTIVGSKGLGKNSDNYELLQGDDTAWGTDYMNVDAGAPYDPPIVTRRMLLSITGVVEQYTSLPTWDYYQVNTRGAADIVAGDLVPAVSEWGMIALSLLTIIAGTVVLRRSAA
ncbi:MAG: IPTL-CTERM sorting domain-containing protein [Planctomycetota bacterium]